jgi:hypothetical protein
VNGQWVLTTASAAVQRFVPTAPGQSVKLYSAVGVGEREGVHIFQNAGPYPIAILDSTGVPRAFLCEGESTSVDQYDDATAAGKWGFPGAKRWIEIMGVLRTTTLTPGTNTKIKAISLDADRDMLLFGDTTLYAVVHNKTQATWGTPTLVRATVGAGFWEGIFHSTDKVLVVSQSTTAFEAVALTTSGNTITVNTAGTQTMAVGPGAVGTLLLVGTSAVWSYRSVNTTNQPSLIGISVSGTTVACGVEVTIGLANSNATPPALFLSRVHHRCHQLGFHER